MKGTAADGPLSKAKELMADLVVVGSRAMPGIQRVLGSVANTVAHGVHCSVLIVDTIE